MSNAKPMAAIAQISHWMGVSRVAMGIVGRLLRIPRAGPDRCALARCTLAEHPDLERMPAGVVDAGRRVTELVAGAELAQGGDERALEPRSAGAVDHRAAGGGGEIAEEALDAGVARLAGGGGGRDRLRRTTRLVQQARAAGHDRVDDQIGAR